MVMKIPYIKTIIGALFLVVFVFCIPMMVENLDSSEIMVIQSISGELHVYTEPGPYWQGFGKVTTYPRQRQYSFCSTIDPKNGQEYQCQNATSSAKRVRFSEGGHALLNGAVNWSMPLDKESIIKIHKQFNNAEAVQEAAVGKTLDSAIYFAGPMMTSTESSGARRGELVQYIDDQAVHGIYSTEAKEVIVKDANGDKQTTTVTSIMKDKGGIPLRQQGSLLEQFHIQLQPLSINELKYDPVVEAQIADRQKSTTQVQLAIATATMAEQQAKTAESTGKAEAAKAKWAQEVVKATVVTKAQQELEVATLAAKQAEQYKREQILIGEGNAAKRHLEMQANGALEQKLAAYVEVNKAYAEAIANANPGAWVSTTSMGGSGGKGSNAAELVDLLTARTARQLSLDTTIEKK
jgi:hypothetical protein